MTQLPNTFRARVAEAKITRYLLDPAHSREAAAKTRFFVSHGFSQADWEELRTALLYHPRVNAVTAATRTPYGEKYEVSCSLVTPSGRNPCVITVWIVEPSDAYPRFVTAYPNPP